MKYVIDGKEYELLKNNKNGFNPDDLEGKITDYFDNFDYIFGDYAYGKVRLKGFNEKSNKYYKPINDIAILEDYIKENCAYECSYFLLKTVKSVETK